MQVKKNDKANLERRKFIFLELSLALALAVVLVAFEWTSSEAGAGSLGDLSVEDVFEEEIDNTFMDEEPPPPEPEPEPEPEQEVIEELNIVEDDVEVDDFIDFDTDDDENSASTNITMSDFSDEEEEVEPISFAVVEQKPVFPGGDAALMKFIAEHTNYPEIAKENGIQGRVFVQFVISASGSVTSVTLARGVDSYLDEEALRVVKMIPPWAPGKQRGKAVPVTYVVPINFKLY
jgi:protein TonB